MKLISLAVVVAVLIEGYLAASVNGPIEHSKILVKRQAPSFPFFMPPNMFRPNLGPPGMGAMGLPHMGAMGLPNMGAMGPPNMGAMGLHNMSAMGLPYMGPMGLPFMGAMGLPNMFPPNMFNPANQTIAGPPQGNNSTSAVQNSTVSDGA